MKRTTSVVMTMVLAVVSIIAPGVTGAQTSEPELPIGQALQATLDKGVEEFGAMGMSAAVIVPGYQPWVGVSGVSHDDVPITPDTVFSAGSIAKNFVAALVLQLVEEGQIGLDDPLSQWLPDYPNVDNGITIRQLLSHTSGLFNFTRNDAYWAAVLAEPDRVWPIDEVLVSYVLEPEFLPGTDWRYANTNYSLLRMIVGEATGTPVAAGLRERFFDPLGLARTFWVLDEPVSGPVAHGWFDLDGDGQYDDLGGEPTAAFYSSIGGDVFCSAQDLAAWTHALYHDGQVLSPDALDVMLAFYPAEDPTEPIVAAYGLGAMKFAPFLTNGIETWGHGGNAIGYAAGSLYLPDYGVSIGLLTNTESGEGMMMLTEFVTIITDYLDKNP